MRLCANLVLAIVLSHVQPWCGHVVHVGAVPVDNTANTRSLGERTECATNPCRNGGSCFLNDQVGTNEGSGQALWVCRCIGEYAGKLCTGSFDGADEDIDRESTPCAGDNPCMHGGECYISSAPAGYKCVCADGFLGSTCKLGSSVDSAVDTALGNKTLKRQRDAARKRVAELEVELTKLRGSPHIAESPQATSSDVSSTIDFAAAKVQLRKKLVDLQQTAAAAGCACTRTLSPDFPLGGLGNNLHQLGLELVTSIASGRMLISPMQFALYENGTMRVEARAVESPYATHATLEKLCKGDKTLDCFFLPLAHCRPEDVALSECPTREAVMKEYQKKYPVNYCEQCANTAARATVYNPELHVSVRSKGGLIGWLEENAKLLVLDDDEKPKGEKGSKQWLRTGGHARQIMAEQQAQRDPDQTVRSMGSERVLEEFVHLGDLWVFSQIMGYVWRLKPKIMRMVDADPLWMPLKKAHKYMAFHMRVTDNSLALNHHGLSKELYTLKHYMQMAEKVREQHPDINTIYVAADRFDSTQCAQWADKWKFVYNEAVSKDDGSNKTQHEYYLKDPHTLDVILDVEIMKRADFIFGSMASNFYKLAAELNYFHHDDQLKRFHEVDRIPWEKQML